MAEIISKDIHWKKGEEGVQKIELYDSDGVAERNGTGKTYQFKFWDEKTNALKGTGTLNPTNLATGKFDLVVLSSFTNTVGDFAGEIIEDPTTNKLKSNTFRVYVDKSSEGLV